MLWEERADLDLARRLESLARRRPGDDHGNACVGPGRLTDTVRTVVHSATTGRLIVVEGVRDLVVVDLPGATVISGRPPEGPAAAPPEPSLTHLADCRTVDKPWGREVWWAVEEAYAAKRLEVRAHHALSLQYHQRKHETLYFLAGRVRLQLGGAEHIVGAGQVAVVPPRTVHRLEALTDAVILEVSTPQLDDVVRLEDRYGRAPAGGAPGAERG